MPKVNVARQRYQAKVQNNQIVAQLNSLRAAGYSTEDIRKLNQKPAATPTAPTTPAVTPGTPGGPPQWWQIARQYGTPATTGTGWSGDLGYTPRQVRREGYTPVRVTPPAWQQSLLSAYGQTVPVQYRVPQTAGRQAAVSPTFGPQGPMQWWQFAKQYSLPKQPPESPLDDFYFRHLDQPNIMTPSTSSGGGYGYGGGYRRRGRGGRGYSYTPRNYAPSYTPENAPGWALGGLANWTIG